MTTKRYILIYIDGNESKWVDSDDIELLQGVINRCSWMKDYQLLDTALAKEITL